MAVTVRIPTPLRTLTGGADEVSADGGTVAEVIENLETALKEGDTLSIVPAIAGGASR